MPVSPPAQTSPAGRARRRPAVKQVTPGPCSTLLQGGSTGQEPTSSRRRSTPLFTSGLELGHEERHLQGCVIQRLRRHYPRAGNEKLARKLNRSMSLKTNEERVRRLRSSLPEPLARSPLHRKPSKQYRPRFPVIVAEDCLWPLL